MKGAARCTKNRYPRESAITVSSLVLKCLAPTDDKSSRVQHPSHAPPLPKLRSNDLREASSVSALAISPRRVGSGQALVKIKTPIDQYLSTRVPSRTTWRWRRPSHDVKLEVLFRCMLDVRGKGENSVLGLVSFSPVWVFLTVDAVEALDSSCKLVVSAFVTSQCAPRGIHACLFGVDRVREAMDRSSYRGR